MSFVFFLYQFNFNWIGLNINLNFVYPISIGLIEDYFNLWILNNLFLELNKTKFNKYYKTKLIKFTTNKKSQDLKDHFELN